MNQLAGEEFQGDCQRRRELILIPCSPFICCQHSAWVLRSRDNPVRLYPHSGLTDESALGHLCFSEEPSLRFSMGLSALRMCAGVLGVGRVGEADLLGGRPRASVVTAVGQNLTRDFYVIGPLSFNIHVLGI